jgi:hypothetical protein
MLPKPSFKKEEKMINDVRGVLLDKIQKTLEKIESKKGKDRESIVKDKVNISTLAKKLSETASQPLLREDKIKIAKVRIKQDFYSNKTKEIANSILKEIFD